MIIVKAVDTAQNIAFYVRDHDGTTYDIEVTNEETNEVTTFTDLLGIIDEGFLTIEISYPFQEGRFYMISTSDGTKVINLSKMYATNQTNMPKYSVLNDYYTTPPVDENEYIVKQ